MTVMMTPAALTDGVDRGALAAVALADVVTVSSVTGLHGWVRDLSKALEAGRAGLSLAGAPGVGAWHPTAVVVGGWTTALKCCDGEPPPDPRTWGVANPNRAWVCSSCLEPVPPTVWASIPLRPDVDSAGALGWRLPSPSAAAEAAGVGWERWLSLVHAWAEADARTEARHVEALLGASAGDVDSARLHVSSLDDLFAGWPGKPETAVAAAWGDRTLQLGYQRPVPRPGNPACFDAEFVAVESIELDAAAATRLWTKERVEAAAADLGSEGLRDQWRHETGTDPPLWLIPSEPAEMDKVLGELHLRRSAHQRAQSSVEL